MQEVFLVLQASAPAHPTGKAMAVWKNLSARNFQPTHQYLCSLTSVFQQKSERNLTVVRRFWEAGTKDSEVMATVE